MSKISSITRVLEIIETVSYSSKPVTPLELSKKLNIPKPTVHRLIKNLSEEGFITVNDSGGVVPGSRVRNLSIELWQQRRYFNERQVILQRLVTDIKETCGIAAPYNLNMVYTNHAQTMLPLQVYIPVGEKSPLWCTATGKLYLSQLSIHARHKVLEKLTLHRFTRNTIYNMEVLNAELDQIAKTGIGVDNEEFISEMVAIAVPILDSNSKYLASLYMHAPTTRISLVELLTYVPRLKIAAQEIQTLIDESQD